MRYTLDRLRCFGESCFVQAVNGARTFEDGGPAYFITLIEKRDNVPLFRVSYSDGINGPLQKDGSWLLLGENVNFLPARSIIRSHFQSTYEELNKRT